MTVKLTLADLRVYDCPTRDHPIGPGCVYGPTLSDLVEVIESEGGKVVTLHGPLLVPDRFDASGDTALEPGRYAILPIPEGTQ